MAFSPDGRLLATAGEKTVRLWNPATGERIRTLTGHTDSVWAVAFSPYGRLLATGSGDKTARLWNPATGERIVTLTGHTNSVGAVAFSPDGRLLATAVGTNAGGDDTTWLWNPATGEHVRTLTGEAMAFSPDWRLLATVGSNADGDDTTWLWNPPPGSTSAPSPATPAWSRRWRSVPTGACSPPGASTIRRGYGTERSHQRRTAARRSQPTS